MEFRGTLLNVYGGTKCHDRRSLEIKIQRIKLTKFFWQTKQRISQTPILKIKEPTDRRYRFHITSSPRRSSRFSVHRIISPQTHLESLKPRRRPARAMARVCRAVLIFVARSVSLVEQASKTSKFLAWIKACGFVEINVLITTRK